MYTSDSEKYNSEREKNKRAMSQGGKGKENVKDNGKKKETTATSKTEEWGTLHRF